MNNIENVSRRGFLKGAFCSRNICAGPAAGSKAAVGKGLSDAAVVFQPDIFLSIASDGTVTIVASRSEMGCGSRTALPLVVADELDADWAKVKIDQAIGDAKYGDRTPTARIRFAASSTRCGKSALRAA